MDKLYVKISDTPSKQAKGLMFVKSMPENEGMLFNFGRSQKLTFWGVNTYIPLDIAFVDKDGLIRQISKIAPMSEKTVSSDVPCKYAIETNDGYFNGCKLEPGDKMNIHEDEGESFLTFDSKRRNCDRTSSSSKARQIMSQLMTQEEAYDLPEVADPSEIEEANLPTISAEDLSKYLADEEDRPAEEVAPEEPEMPMPEKIPQVEEPITEYPSFSNAFDATEWAKKNKEVMRISYTTKSGTGLVRDIEPHGKFHADTTGHQILVTFDRSIGDIRAFIMQNVSQFAFTGDKFEPRFKVV